MDVPLYVARIDEAMMSFRLKECAAGSSPTHQSGLEALRRMMRSPPLMKAVAWNAALTSFTVIVNDLSSLRDPSLARTVAPYVPASAKPGARWTFPVVALVVVTVINPGPPTFEKVRASPSGSVALRDWFAVAPSSTVISVGCARTGGPFCAAALTVIVKPFVSLSAPSLADAEAE